MVVDEEKDGQEERVGNYQNTLPASNEDDRVDFVEIEAITVLSDNISPSDDAPSPPEAPETADHETPLVQAYPIAPAQLEENNFAQARAVPIHDGNFTSEQERQLVLGFQIVLTFGDDGVPTTIPDVTVLPITAVVTQSPPRS